MQMIRRFAKPVSYLLIMAMTMLSVPLHQVRAEMVGTEAVIEAESGVSGESISSDRARIKLLQQREKARAQLEEYGLSADEAQTWVASLTDGEVAMVADNLNQIFAGGAGEGEDMPTGAIIGGVLVIALVLLLAAVIAFGAQAGCPCL